MDYVQMTAPCGLDCFNCPMYHAREDENLRRALSRRMGIPPENARCEGCRNEGGVIAFLGMSEPCKAYLCTKERGILFCGDCKDFPCDHLHPYADRATQVPHNIKVFNLCLIKRMGVEAWARERAKAVRETYFHEKWKL